jgi:NCS1 nucleoside transporter family
MSVCIPTYMLASGLIAEGMDWIQAIVTILLGNLIVLIPMLLNAHAGTRYGIPFPVFVRASFGVRGANVPAILRALVACGWFGIQTWIGGQAIYSMLCILWPNAGKFAGLHWVCFLFFWAINMFVIWRGIETIKFLEGIGAPFMLIVGLLLLLWVTRKAGGFEPSPQSNLFPYRWAHHRRDRHFDDAVEITEHLQRVHFWLAGGLLRVAWTHCRDHDLLLLPGATPRALDRGSVPPGRRL